MAGLFQVLHGKSDGTFTPAKILNGTDGQPLIIPTKDKDQLIEKICTRPFAIDWDGDGKLDLVVGTFAGSFYWFKGEGKGKFQPKPEVIKSGGKPLKIIGRQGDGHHSDPFVIDWDGDGDLDILSGSSDGSIQWSENRGGKGKPPEMTTFQVLIASAKDIPYGQPLKEEDLKGPANSTRIWVADINGDGKLDLLVGDNVNLVSPAKGLSDEEFKKKVDAWQAEVAEVSKEINAEASEEKRNAANLKFNKLYEKRSTFMTEKRTGFVWLYLQK